MFNILFTLTESKIAELCDYFSQNITLGRDVSNYAKGRQRSWLNHEATLTTTPTFTPAIQDTYIWQEMLTICSQIEFAPDLGLVSLGGEIKPHRDASYADFRAIGINLGSVTWGYEQAYPTFCWVPEAELNQPPPVQELHLNGGEVFEFNCKNRHWTSNPSPDRWGINLWRISRKALPSFNAYEMNL